MGTVEEFLAGVTSAWWADSTGINPDLAAAEHKIALTIRLNEDGIIRAGFSVETLGIGLEAIPLEIAALADPRKAGYHRAWQCLTTLRRRLEG